MNRVSALWPFPPEPLILADDEVHVWRASLSLPPSRLRGLWHTLSQDEQIRAARFYAQKDRDRYTVARGLLRAILGLYLKTRPEQIGLCYGPFGKPALCPPEQGEAPLRFNLSKSHGLALFAFTRGRELGVDLERIRPQPADGRIAERFFSPQEVAALRTLPKKAQAEAFFNCWTRKEAYIKAKGAGLSLPLDQFEVSLIPETPAALLSAKWDPQEAARWSLRALTPAPDYAAALAVEGRLWRLRCWRWPESPPGEAGAGA
ncbi:4'-phosphopantetheinyl transferase superfamily protein [bacterium]|nr:4'-phosphopantetheinyl transferase superfamily protein [bacterium]